MKPTGLLLLVAVLLAAAMLINAASFAWEEKSLEPDEPLEEIANVGSILVYRLARLAPSTYYEVRISHPAFYAATFSLELASDAQIRQRHGRAQLGATESEPDFSTGRQLLNTDKLMFTTTAEALVASQPDAQYVVVRVGSDGVPANSRPIVFSIVLETLLPPGAPYSVFGLVLVAGVAGAVAWLMMPLLLRRLRVR